MLWFDDEERQDTTVLENLKTDLQLWFDDEERQDTTKNAAHTCTQLLWFDDEERQDTTDGRLVFRVGSCGLMMKKDKIQQIIQKLNSKISCGLMMKKDKIQQADRRTDTETVVV